MGWTIDRDFIRHHLDMDNLGYPSAIGKGTAHGVADPYTAVRFRLFDDDGHLYYAGRIDADWLDGDELAAFAPLRWAERDSGCTRMDYQRADGKWTTL